MAEDGVGSVHGPGAQHLDNCISRGKRPAPVVAIPGTNESRRGLNHTPEI